MWGEVTGTQDLLPCSRPLLPAWLLTALPLTFYRPPAAGLFSWRKDMLLIKATQGKDWGWQLFGFLQHDSWGRPAFIHRTINKYTIDAEPWAIELITAPMPNR